MTDDSADDFAAAVKPTSFDEFDNEIDGVRQRVHSRLFARKPFTDVLDLVGLEYTEDDSGDDDADGDYGTIRIGVTIQPDSFGLRVGFRAEQSESICAADGSIEFVWKRPMEYDVDLAREYMIARLVPRTVYYVGTLLSDTARSGGMPTKAPTIDAEKKIAQVIVENFSEMMAQSLEV